VSVVRLSSVKLIRRGWSTEHCVTRFSDRVTVRVRIRCKDTHGNQTRAAGLCGCHNFAVPVSI